MRPAEQQPGIPQTPDGDERWALAERVAASVHFSRAPQIQRFLLYVCRRALTEDASEITEYEIGTKVLGRRADYDPKQDNIVRVQARHLRHKLEEYFQSEDRHEPVVITIPKGSYVARFERRPLLPAATDQTVPRARESGPRRFLPTAAAAASLALAIACAWLWIDNMPLRRIPGAERPGADPFWSRVFVKGVKVNVVLSDLSLVLLQEALGREVSLKEYLSPAYPRLMAGGSPALDGVLAVLGDRQLTSVGSAGIGLKMVHLGGKFGMAAVTRYPRHVNIREFKTDNFVLLGSRRSVPWVALFEPVLNYALEADGTSGRFYLRNRAPHPRERPAYRVSPDGEDTYATIAMVPNLGKTGTVLILNGIDMVALEAAGELVTDAGFGARFDQMTRAAPDRRMGFPEILIHVRSTAGTARQAEILGCRFTAPERFMY